MKNIIIVSVGNGGFHAINYMIDSGLNGAEFVSCSTDEMALEMSKSDKKIWLGKNMIQYGLDGSSVERSRKAAIESRKEILETLRGADEIIIVAGLGGYDGTGASPIIAEYAKELGALTVAVVTLPYKFEGVKRTTRAEVGLKNLKKCIDMVVTIRNDEFLKTCDPKTPMTAAFKVLDEILCRAVKSLLALSQNPFRIENVATDKIFNLDA